MKIIYLHGFPPTDQYYDYTLWAKLLKCPWGIPLNKDGNFLAFEMLEKVTKDILNKKTHLLTSSFHNHNVCRDFSSNIALNGVSNKQTLIDKYNIVIVPLVWYFSSFLEWLKLISPGKIIIGVEDDSFREIVMTRSCLTTEIVKGIDICDYIISYSTQIYKWLKGFKKHVIHLPIPIPHSFKKKPNLPDKKRGHICLGILSWNYDLSNSLSNCLAYNQIDKNITNNYQAEIIGFRKSNHNKYRRFELYKKLIPGLQINEWFKNQYYKKLSSYKIVIHLTRRESLARYAAQCAWVATPIIGNIECELQKELWPKLSVDPYDIKNAAKLANRLLTEPDFYIENVNLAKYNLKQIIKKQSQHLKRIKNIIAKVSE